MPNRLRATFQVDRSQDVKAAVLSRVSELYPDVVWESGRAGSAGTTKKTNYDQADAILVALHGVVSLHQAAVCRDPALLRLFLNLATTRRANDADGGDEDDLLALAAAVIDADGEPDSAVFEKSVPQRWASMDAASAKALGRAYTRFVNHTNDVVAEWFASQTYTGK